jgi:Zn-dependent M28 family amino/carboxypeptidase
MLRLAESGAAGFVSIDNPAAIEPTHWPAAYARTVTLLDHPQKPLPNAPIGVRISAEAAPKLFTGTLNGDPARILADAEHGLPLPTLPLANKLRIRIATTEKDIASRNVIAILPGSDPALKPEYVALSAHLDGYGFGTPVHGDNLYNGALDDAAYVATLLELAHNLAHTPPKRSLLFCIFTGEEKGLLGSEYFTHHPTVPAAQIVADLNLDQLRPIFPLNILTMEGIDDSTLGETARAVAAEFHIELRPDREPERNLFRRADNYNFVRIGVPIASFIFGYDSGTAEERAYRDWYATRYHKPQDDLTTPIDWAAAVKFNEFYRALTLAVANASARPSWAPTSAYAPKPHATN